MRAKKNPKRSGPGFESTPKEEGGGDKDLVALAAKALTTSNYSIVNFIVQRKK
jgi:hypothetical protein